MKSLNNISFVTIRNHLTKNNLNVESSISENEMFYNLNSLSNSSHHDLTFFANISSLNILSKTKAKACLIDKKNSKHLQKNTAAIIVEDPYKAFALISNLFQQKYFSSGIIADLTDINNTSKLGNNIQIDNFVNIKENCEIDDNVIIESNCTIGPNVNIYKNTIIKSNSVISDSIIGENSIIQSGAVIGGTGFGFDSKSKTSIQHFGNVIIKKNCNIGSNTTIDRAVFDSTVISENCFIDNLVQIAHNVVLGSGCIIASQTGIAGSTIIGKNVTMGGQVGISGHLIIGDNVTIAAKSGVTKNINNNSIVAGFPAVDLKKWKISTIKFNNL